ncbi:unnamed protein product [Caenorhabditis auriculariae]|uniref:Potassium channel domain-containing protein n=1 Tax=Caenorhabditis auriculariae TaxID=2777116 RepID=A0A8S1GUK5_9PELO|nr:unnamed protein product [Caenorhabditis auriculariae]
MSALHIWSPSTASQSSMSSEAGTPVTVVLNDVIVDLIHSDTETSVFLYHVEDEEEEEPTIFDEKKIPDERAGSSVSQPLNTKKSLGDLAQFMLPALIESQSEKEENSRRRTIRRNPNGNRLLQMANARLRKGAAGFMDIAERAHSAGKRRVEKLQQKPPLWMVIVNRAYHKYGLKHLVLILVFLAYTAFGGLIFWLIEEPYQTDLRDQWNEKISLNRTQRVGALMHRMFNNSEYLVYIKGNTTLRLVDLLHDELIMYERQLGIKWSQQKMDWDFWNALLFAGTICTTIGYGHIYPMTSAGRILTMVFALFGIPLMLLVLQDFGKLLTITMKFPWFQTKRLLRRIMRCCTKQSLSDMRAIEDQERRDLDIFDLPLPVGIGLIVLWIFVCASVLSMWDQNWTLLESFYFFFTSLSTVGLGDLVPSSPRLLITMFGFILVGLSLVSMVINLLQLKMKTTYEAGHVEDGAPPPNVTTLGILQCFEEDDKKSPLSERSLSRSTQTSLSLPGVKQVVLRSDGVHWVSDVTSPMKSPDEVTHLVENESGLRVCEQIGDNNHEDYSEAESLTYETDALLEVAESHSDLEIVG